MRLYGKTLVGLGACALSLMACGGESSVESSFDEGTGGTVSLGADSLSSILALASTAPWTTRFAGTRRVESHIEVDGEMVDLVYRESVVADGQGNFSVDPVAILSWIPDPSSLLNILKLREGFLYRYRDFHIQDLNAFYSNYIAIDMGLEVEVAGRTCGVLQVQRHEAGSHIYYVALDVSTGMPLRFEEQDSQGVPITVMEFEAYDSNPDLDLAVWFASSNQESPLDITQDLAPQVGFDVLSPKVLPDGYQLWKAATLIGPDDKTWLKQSFTDGVEVLFFLHESGEIPLGHSVIGTATSHAADVQKGDEVWVYQMGAVNVVQGVIRKTDVITLGKVDSEDLLDLLESAVL